MTFDHPAMLLLLYALIPLLILMAVNYKIRFTRIYSVAAPLSTIFYDDVGKTRKKRSKRLPVRVELSLRYAASCLLFIIFYICLCLALAGPCFGVHFVRELRRGADVVLAFDLSRSMNVRDAAPLPPAAGRRQAAAGDTNGTAPAIRGELSSSRLERSIYTAKKLLEYLLPDRAAPQNIRFGAALGKGEAILAIPLTDDSEAVLALLDSLTSLAITSRGTNLEKILDAAAGAFQDNFPSARYVALFSDGEALSGSLQAALERLREQNITLFTVGSGSVYGAPVPEDASFETVNSSGKPPAAITSYLRQDVLSAAAERTGGTFIDGNTGAAAFLAGLINADGMTDGEWVFREESNAMWHIFTIVGLAAFILSKLCSLRFRGRRAGQ
ncbi:MAG: VWA domain-containing protein [Spirochaetaceae bacterium]|jgi:Ca-activated chloride channel family protein|nr:VWA domain-containing protein [Spirochaetaceae bacterium]